MDFFCGSIRGIRTSRGIRPQYYVDMYDPGYEGDELIYPCYGFSNYMTDEELNHVTRTVRG